MHRLGHSSSLQAMWQAPPTKSQHAITGAMANDAHVQLTQDALQRLKKLVSGDPELSRGAKELYNYVSNLRLTVPGASLSAQLQALYPIRYTLNWIPQALYRLAARDPWVLLFFAHYNMVAIAIEPFFPAAANSLAVAKRAELVEKTADMFERLNVHSTEHLPPGHPMQDAKNLHAAIAAPLALAKHYRARHFDTNSHPLRRALIVGRLEG